MPVRSGHSLIERIRRDERTQDIPVCVVSADASGAPVGTLVVKKPFELLELRDALRRVLRR
jgi:CheY-like chemotaxis protein